MDAGGTAGACSARLIGMYSAFTLGLFRDVGAGSSMHRSIRLAMVLHSPMWRMCARIASGAFGLWWHC